MERLTIKNSDGTYSQPTHTTFEKMFYKLAEVEDFLEENYYEDFEEFVVDYERMDNSLGYKQEIINFFKDRWEKLKDYAEKHFEEEPASLAVAFRKVLVKMQELEKGETNGSK